MRSFPAARTESRPQTSLNQKPAFAPVLSHSGRRRASAVPPDLPPARGRWTLVGSSIGLHSDALFCASAPKRIPAFRVVAGSQSRPASLFDVLAVLLSVVAVGLCVLSRARTYEVAL